MVGGSKLILVVDDEAKVRARMARLLRGMGYEVVTSRDYAEGAALYQRRQSEIDMVVADVSLPGNYGCELAKSALRANPEVTVLFVSGNAGAEVCRFYGVEPTGVHFLKKPFSDSALTDRVRQLLEPAEARPKEAACAAGAGGQFFEAGESQPVESEPSNEDD